MAEVPSVQEACETCGFVPWTPRPGARCERDGCVQPGSSWWHDKSGIHWLVCDRHQQAGEQRG